MKRITGALCAVFALSATFAEAAIDLNAIKPDGFAKGVVLTVDGYAAGRPALTNFPVLVRISETGISGFAYTDSLVSEGGDIRFAAADGTPLPFEKDTWRGANDVSLFWVTLPRMTNGTEFAMFYGASQNDANAFAAARHPWADYTGVWHLGDGGNGSGVTVSDSTTNALQGTTGATTSKFMSDGAIGGARKITTDENGKPKDQISVSLADSAKKAQVDALVPQFAVSLWYRLASSSETSIQWDYLIGRKREEKVNNDNAKGWAIQMSDPSTGGGVKYGIRLWSCETGEGAPPSPAIPVIGKDQWTKSGTWFKLDAVYNNSTYSFYTNGVFVQSGELKGPATNGPESSLGIGGGVPIATGKIRPFTGDMDEVRLRCGTVSDDWVSADYATQASPSFLSAGTVENVGASTKPIAEFSILDAGAAFIQVSGKVNACGEGATACALEYKLWKDGDLEPASWTQFATGVGAGAAATNFVVGLDTLTDYHVVFKASNNLATPEDSDIQTEPFTTSGVGDAGESGCASERQLDEFVHTFTVTETGVSSFSFSPPIGVTNVEALVVAGGGAGGYYHGGGGGGGGLVHLENFAVEPFANYTITVGTGGVASASESVYGGNGGDSSIASNGVVLVSALGGGAGGNGGSSPYTYCGGMAGGSGGGSSIGSKAGSGTLGQGYAGARGNGNQSGGGGGAAETGSEPAAGGTGAVTSGGGGNGLPFAISGSSTYYAGGGGGGGDKSLANVTYGTAGSGGLGGGGMGGQETETTDTAVAQNGEDNVGGGGGGGSTVGGYYKGGNGGSGVVIIRYGAGGDGDGVVNPTVSLTGLEYDSARNVATLSYRVGWAGDGYDHADVYAIWGFSEDNLSETNCLNLAAIGAGSGTITNFPSVSRTVYVRVIAMNAGNYSGTSPEVRTIALYNPHAPEATISNTSVDFTSAGFSVNVTSLGLGASSAVVSLQSCANRAFAGGVVTNADLAMVTGADTVSVTATGLADSSTLWFRAVLTNDIAQVYETDPISITTITPGEPAGVCSITDIGYTTLETSVRVTIIGYGSTNTVRWLEVSESDGFSTLVGSSTRISNDHVGIDEVLAVTGLSPNTTYYSRLVLENKYRTIYVPVKRFSTRGEPFAAIGPTWAAGNGTFDFSLVVAAVYDGATCSATLTYGNTGTGTRNFNTAGTVTWNGVPAAADGAEAEIVVTAALPNNGGTFTKTYEAPVAAGSSGIAVTDVSTRASAVGALWVRPGDVVALPSLLGGASYQSLNERFATVEGSTLVAHESGIVGVRCVDASYTTNVMGVVILPDPIGSGNVYVYKETGRNGNIVCDWSRPACWDKVENGARAASNTGCPTNADDIAVLPFYTLTGDQYIRHCTDISVGGVYSGLIRPDASLNCHMERYKYTDLSNKTEETAPHTVTFRRSDGKPVEIKVCPNSEGGNYSRFVLGGYDIDVVWASDAVIDGCSSETDVNGPRGRFYVKTANSTNTLQGVTLTFRGYPGSAISGNGCTDTLKGVWKGTGTIVKEGLGGIAFDGDFSGFSGTIREKSSSDLGIISSPAAGVLMRAAGASNVTAHVYGWGVYNPSSGAMSYNYASQGKLATGGASVAPALGAQGPAKGLHLHGGTYRANKIDNSTWSAVGKDEKAFDVLSIGAGLNYISMEGGGDGTSKPINAVTAKTLAQSDKGTFVLFDPSVSGNAKQGTTNCMFTVQDWANHAIGGTGYGESGIAGATDDFAIVPWIVANGDGNFSFLQFPAVDANGRLVRPVRTSTAIDEVSGPDANAICSDGYGNLVHGSAPNIVVNSLFLNNSVQGTQWLSADRTLTITSGGLILRNGSAIGLPDHQDENGTLVLGDATRPAYVWNQAWGDLTNRIWAAVSAPGGFVSTYTGNLELGGDQRGIAGEIVVNGGTLALGDSGYGCTLARKLPVRVCAGATLILPNRDTLAANPIMLDGSGGAFGKVALPINQTVRKVSVRDVAESVEWTALPRGTYGTSASNATYARDDLFTGPGILTVTHDDKPLGTMLIMR